MGREARRGIEGGLMGREARRGIEGGTCATRVTRGTILLAISKGLRAGNGRLMAWRFAQGKGKAEGMALCAREFLEIIVPRVTRVAHVPR